MILLAAPDVSDPLVAALRDAIQPAVLIEHRAGTELFTPAFEARAELIIAVEKIPRLGADSPTHDDALFDAVLAAAHAPCVKRLMFVTTRTDDDPALQRLKRDGAAYVIVRTGPVATLEAGGDVRGRRVLVRTDLPAPERGGATIAQIADTVRGAIADRDCAGRAIELSLNGIELVERLIADAGARPIKSAGWKATGLQWIGLPQVIPSELGAKISKRWEKPQGEASSGRRPHI